MKETNGIITETKDMIKETKGMMTGTDESNDEKIIRGMARCIPCGLVISSKNLHISKYPKGGIIAVENLDQLNNEKPVPQKWAEEEVIYDDANKGIKIIKPTLENLEEVLAVEESAWPDIGQGMVADKKKFENRIEIGGMLLLYLKGAPVGIISYQNPAFAKAQKMDGLWDEFIQPQKHLLNWQHLISKYNLPKNWYEATNDGYVHKDCNTTHDPQSDCLFLIGVGVSSQMKGCGLVNLLISQTLKEAKKKGKKYVLGYGRLPQLQEACFNKAPTLEQAEQHLLKRKINTNLPYDYGARFHVRNGAEPIAVIPEAMDDPESGNYGFLALYKL